MKIIVNQRNQNASTLKSKMRSLQFSDEVIRHATNIPRIHVLKIVVILSFFGICLWPLTLILSNEYSKLIMFAHMLQIIITWVFYFFEHERAIWKIEQNIIDKGMFLRGNVVRYSVHPVYKFPNKRKFNIYYEFTLPDASTICAL